MHMTLTKDKMVEIIRSKLNPEFSSHEIKKLVELILDTVKNHLELGKDVKVSGFGKWFVKQKRERQGRNPHTGNSIVIQERKVVSFHPSESLRQAIDNANLPKDKVIIVGKARQTTKNKAR
jgi:integration host factor subunit alpha